MSIKSVRIFIKYARKFLAGFVSVIPFVSINSKQDQFFDAEFRDVLDLRAIDEDINIAIKKKSKNDK